MAPNKGNTDPSSLHLLSLPALVVRNMKLPFLCNIHWKTSRHTKPSLRVALSSNENAHTFLRLCWTCEWFGGVKQVLTWHDIKLTEQPDFSEDLRACQFDLDCLKCTSISHCSKQCLFNIQNGTTHQAVENGIKRMLGYITLQALLKERSEVELQSSWKSMPWEATLIRFFGTSPACPEDEELLISLLQFLCVCVRNLSPSDIRKPQWTWIYRTLKDPSQTLPSMLKMDSGLGSKNICREILLLCQECCLLEHQLEEEENGKNKADVISWVYIVHIIAQNLKFSDTQHFYNLAFLDWMLTCLSHVTGNLGWSRGCSNTVQLLSELICYLTELVTAFHCNKGGQGGTSLASFMGMSITRSATICLNHVLCEMQNSSTVRGWEAAWFSALKGSKLEEGIDLTWLSTLWLSRDPIIRSSALQLMSGLCSTQLGSRFVIQGLRGSPSCIWEVALGFLLDQGEACMVREQAAIILTNLSSQNISAGTKESSSKIECSNTIETTQSGVQTFISLLEESNFYCEVGTIASSLFLGPTFKPVNIPTSPWTAESLSGTILPQEAKLQKDHFVFVYNRHTEENISSEPDASDSQDTTSLHTVATPNLVKALCWLINNLLTVSPDEIIKNINNFGLMRILFRCICSMPDEAKTKGELMLYSEILEMYTAVCTVLAKCVCMDMDCLSTALNTSDCIMNLLALLNPSLYYTHRLDLIQLRNRLWSRVFRLLSCILTGNKGYQAIIDVLFQSDPKAFLTTLQTSINGKSSSDLRNSALSSLTSLLSFETKHRSFDSNSSKTEDSNTSKTSLQTVLDKNASANDSTTHETPVSGSDLCALLLNLYDVQNLRHGSGDNKGPSIFARTTVLSALSSLLAVSQQAKKYALSEGFLESIMFHLKELHVRLSVEAVDCIRRTSDKKKIHPVLQEVCLLFSLLTNFLYDAPNVKVAAIGVGLSDMVHKLWVWCSLASSLLGDTLKLLCTFTSNCISACQSLVYTTPVLGVSFRKTPSSQSLLHEVINLIPREIEMLSKGSDTTIVSLSFHLLRNASHAQECRIALFKGSIFSHFNKLHPSVAKKQKFADMLELLWMQFLVDCTFYPEGQVGLPKVPEVIDTLISIAELSKATVRRLSLAVLRNVAFHQINRSRLLASNAFLQLMMKKLNDGDIEEKNMVIEMIWALVANNQKAKLVLKNSGIVNKLQEMVNQEKLLNEMNGCNLQSQVLNYVIKIIHADRKLKKS